MGIREYLSQDKQGALKNLETCRTVSEEFENFHSIFLDASTSGKLKLDKKMEEEFIGTILWAPLSIMLITETSEKISKSTGFAMDIESNKILKQLKKSATKIGFSYKTLEGVLAQIYPSFRNESFENARVALMYWNEIMMQVDKQKINSNNIQKNWNKFFKSVNFL